MVISISHTFFSHFLKYIYQNGIWFDDNSFPESVVLVCYTEMNGKNNKWPTNNKTKEHINWLLNLQLVEEASYRLGNVLPGLILFFFFILIFLCIGSEKWKTTLYIYIKYKYKGIIITIDSSLMVSIERTVTWKYTFKILKYLK